MRYCHPRRDGLEWGVMNKELAKGETLISQGAQSTEIYILVDGKLDVLIKDRRGREKKISQIKDRGAIIGDIGAILNAPRTATVRAAETSMLQVIDVKNRSLDDTIIAQPRLGLSMSLNLAKYLKATNEHLSRHSAFLTKIRKQVDDYLLFYYKKVAAVAALYEKLRFPWLKSIYEKTKDHMIFGMGESVSRGEEVIKKAEVQVSAPSTTPAPELKGGQSFAAGDTLCKEGDEGREIFILQSGSLEVRVGERVVATIADKGAVIGEIAVLTSYVSRKFEKRTATIICREAAQVIVIDGTKLEAVISANPSLILFIVKILSERLPVTNEALMATVEQIRKYIALLDSTAVTSMTIPNGYDMFRSCLRNSARDKAEVEGMEEEITDRLTKVSDDFRDMGDELDALTAQIQ